MATLSYLHMFFPHVLKRIFLPIFAKITTVRVLPPDLKTKAHTIYRHKMPQYATS